MGITDNLKDLYFAAEDKYYRVLDKINKFVPIYKIVDPIDKAVPSFLLLILAIAVLAVGLIVLPALSVSQTELTLVVEDELGNGLPGIDISYKLGSVTQNITTDADGKARLILSAGESVRVKISETTVNEVEYKALESTIEILDEDMEKRLILERKTLPLIERTLVFQNASGGRIAGQAFKIRLSCSSGVIPIPQEVSDLDRDGAITVTEPPECGVMQATVLEPEEFAGDVYLLDKTTVILRLENDEVEKGSVRVKIKNEDGRIIDEVNFNISLKDSDGLTLQEKDSQYFGEVIFRDVVPGEYNIGVVDPRDDYAIATESGIFVSANETESVTVVVSKSIKGTLEIKAISLNNGSDISEATIRLIDSSGRIVVEDETGENGEAVIFPLMNEDDYTIFAMHEDYLYGELDLNGQIDGSVDVEMEILTATNSGKIEVKVLDEDDEVVENARVKLRFLDTDFLAPYHPQVTDFNGIARFSGVRAGSYYAYVEKFPTSGDNKGFGLEIDIRKITKFTVSLFVGETTINITAVDEDQDPVPEAEVEFFSITGKSLGKIPLTDGTGTYSLKADKKIYLVVKHPNFQQVQTMPEQLYPGSTIDFVAELEPRLISGEPIIEYLGIFTPSGGTASAIESGQRYIMKFKFSVPHLEDYDSAGVHFRVGNERLLANDPLIIREVIVGNANAPLKGTTFTPPTGYEQDLENLTEGDAKWVNFEWTDIEAGNYFFGIEVRVKSQITPNTLLPMHYRAWAKPSANQVTRDPYDSTLGIDESTSSKQALYAKAYYLEYYEAESVQCDEEFCYSGEWVRDEDQELYIYRPYSVRINAPHKFNFVISNNSDTVYENSKLYITSLFGGMKIKGYEIQDAEARTITAENINVSTIEDIELGTFTKGKTINAQLDFVPKEVGSDYFEIKIVADGKVVFQKDVYFSLESQLNMLISVEPDLLPSFVEFPLIATIQEVDEDGLTLELEDALVIVTKTAADRSEVVWTGRSNSFGKAEFTIPASPAGTKITVEAEMPGYSADPVVLYIDANVLRFDPAKIVSALSTRDQTEEIIFETIKNLIPSDLKLINTQVRGYFKGLLDETTMENYLAQFRGLEINEMGTVERELFKVKLSENASVLLKRADSVEGEFWLTFKNEAANVVYDFVIPLKANITISGLPETEDCLVITKSEWTTVTQGNAATLEFEVQNNCMSDGKFLPLDKIVSTIEWTSDIMGNIELSLTDSQTGETNIETLKPIIPATLFENVRPENVYYGLLTFTPFQGYLGDDAQFQVYINGQMFTGADEGYENVGSTPEYINSKIKIINLDSCITYEGAETVVIV
ncbi:MAG: hypothetical protein QGI60_01380, partial [archaeon]|nr:hypothetical protein [archaeon]